MVRRATSEDGFGLVELLIAMVVMVVGISALVAAYTSGMVAVNRANQVGTAGTLADKQMEAFRALPYNRIALSGPSADPVYTGDSALTGDSQTGTLNLIDALASWPAVQSVPGPDGRTYRLDTFIVWHCPLGTLTTSGAYAPPATPGCLTGAAIMARAVKQVTVVVRDGADPSKVYMRESSTFDQAT